VLLEDLLELAADLLPGEPLRHQLLPRFGHRLALGGVLQEL
jgi:hypothetical protein